MESRVNYTLVGLFVLFLGAIGIFIPLWLTSGLNQQEFRTYIVYMNESVDGLSPSAGVNYNGVDVGHVKQIKLNPHNTEQVILLLDIKAGTPITTNTTATLQSQGITGVAYIGLSGGKLQNAQPLQTLPGETYPRIKAMPSIRVRLDTALTTLMNDLNALNKQLNNLISPANTKALSEILKNINSLSSDLSAHGENMGKSIDALNKLMQQLSQTSQNFPETSQHFQEVLSNLQSLSEEIKQNPSVVIRGKTQRSLGPGEK
jgi:phospholipid/cholesterol/gamma-HCH transport system substrate-binding protein